jgi:hypothetical protein
MSEYEEYVKRPWVLAVSWISVGMGLIFFNKIIITVWGFPYPFFLTCMHQVFATVATRLLHAWTPLLASVKEGKLTQELWLRKALPMAFAYSTALVMGNSAYKYLSLSYIQMLKSCTPVPTFAASFIAGREGKSLDPLQFVLIVIISCGAIASSVGETYWSLVGFSLMIGAIISDVGRMFCIDYLTIDVKLDTLSTLYYMAPLASMFIFCGFLAFEASDFFASGGGYEMITSSPAFCVCLLLNACTAMTLNCVIVLFVTNAGIMTMALAGIAKDILVVILSVVFFRRSVLTPTQVSGYSASLTGLVLYREHKRDPERVVGWLSSAKTEVCRQVDVFLCCLKIGQGRRNRLAEAVAVATAEDGQGAEYEMVSVEEAEEDDEVDSE